MVRTSILEAMMMLKKNWGEVTEQTIRKCFLKLGISLEAQEGTMDDHDDPFKGMVDDGEDESAGDKLEYDLNRLREARPDLAPENLDGLVDFDREVATNESRPLSVGEILTNTFHYLLKPLKMAAVTRMRIPTNPNHHHHEMKLTRQLKSWLD